MMVGGGGSGGVRGSVRMRRKRRKRGREEVLTCPHGRVAAEGEKLIAFDTGEGNVLTICECSDRQFQERITRRH